MGWTGPDRSAQASSITRWRATDAGRWAKQLGRDDCAKLLKQNLMEEEATDKKLTAMAESKVNRRAA